MEEGLYKFDQGTLLYAPNKVIHKDYILEAADHENMSLPVDGWYWFDSLQSACTFFDLDIADYQNEDD